MRPFRILFLTQILPYPPDAGPRVKTWHVIRYLAQQGHHITLITFLREEEIPHLERVEGVCEDVHPVRLKRSKVKDASAWLRSLLTKRPFLIERDDYQVMRSRVRQVLAEADFDIVHADQLSMAQFALGEELIQDSNRFSNGFELGGGKRSSGNDHGQPNGLPPRVFDAHNAVWVILDRMANQSPFPLNRIFHLEASKLRRYEGDIVSRFEHTLAVTQEDREALMEVFPGNATNGKGGIPTGKITVIPIAIDVHSISPRLTQNTSKEIVTLGSMHYPPNAQGILWFAKEVFPHILKAEPAARLTVIGKNPPRELIELAVRYENTIEVTGYVERLGPYMANAELMVVPVLTGGGMRVRILEALARGIPTVTTPVGLEGIEAQSGKEILIAEGVSQFAQAVLRLLSDPALKDTLSSKGRRLVEERYDWRVVLKQVEGVYKQLVNEDHVTA